MTDFHSKDLAKVFAEAEPVLDEYQSRLNLLSEDIKGLEHNLRTRGANVPVKFYVACEDADGDIHGYNVLAWLRHGNQFRIVNYWEPDVENIDLSDNAKPLIEAPVEMRVHLYQYLPNLVKSVVSELRSKFETLPQLPKEPKIDW